MPACQAPRWRSGTAPPSTDHAAPVTFEARSEHSTTTMPATSSRCRTAPWGSCPACASSASSRVIPFAAATWSARPPSSSHRRRLHRPGRHGVHQHAAGRVGVGEHARQRELCRLGHRVGGVGERRPLAGRRAHVHDPPSPALGHPRRGRPHQPHRRHHVQLPLRLPVGVLQLVQRLGLAGAGVVHQHVDGAEAPLALVHDPLGGAGLGHVGPEALAARHAAARARPPPRSTSRWRRRCRGSRRSPRTPCRSIRGPCGHHARP